MPGAGTMGVYRVNGGLAGDAVIDPLAPEAVVYRPDRRGVDHLVAVEDIVFESVWDAEHDAPPSLFVHTFDFTPSPNRFGLPAFYSLHEWVWQHHPAGTVAVFNPAVHC